MGKASRKYDPSKPQKIKRAPIPFVARPFEGLAFENQLVALRDFVPSGYVKVTTKPEYGSRELLLVSYLPEGTPGIMRADGVPMVAVRTTANSRDLSHDLGAAAVAVLKLEDGSALSGFDVRDPGPRLDEVVDTESFEFHMSPNFDFWVEPAKLEDEDVKSALDHTAEETIPTEIVPGTESAFWCRMNHDFVRWIRNEPENRVLDALARLKVRGEAHLGEDTRFIGAFRTCGLIVPVFEMAERTAAADLADAAAQLEKKLVAEIDNRDELTDDERRARAGLVSRQVSLR
ncbi:DUF5926 family protein [Boudabousia marimammalium]|uniref:DUF5926 domain-containing protein n=1 Tax=Boudabousia marimammalium TaxID=156892 RepID=A0A1Q5PSE2_9ACTO|nr:DUF5926 family protein [Boudabousia marimammalium]OKL50453.1 hypothetical protein BM477_00290 [Boudabousia marimammalium]